MAEQGRQLAGRLEVPAVCLGPGGVGPDALALIERPFDPALITGNPESIFQTSGTTGVPKLVHHRQSFYRQVIVLGEDLIASGEHRLRHLSISGLAYLAGQISALLYLFAGGTLAYLLSDILHDWDDDHARKILAEYRRAVPKPV